MPTMPKQARICFLLLIFSIFDETRAFARPLRGVSRITSRRLLLEDQGTEINVRVQDKEDKEDKEDENDKTLAPTESPTEWQTEPPTESPTESPVSPTDQSSTIASSSAPSHQVSSTPTAFEDETASPTTSFPTVYPSSTNEQVPSAATVNNPPFQTDEIQTTLAPTTILVTPVDVPSLSPDFDTESPTVLDETDALDSESTGNATSANGPASNPLGSSGGNTNPTEKSSTGTIIGLVVAFGTLSCLGSIFYVSKRKQNKRTDHVNGDPMSENVSCTTATPPPPLPTKWNDVFQHSLAEEEKIEVSPACRTKSLFQETIIEESETSDLEDVALSPDIEEKVVLRPAHNEKTAYEKPSSVDTVSKDGTLGDATPPDSYTLAVANLLGCGAGGTRKYHGDEMKTEPDLDTESISSEDLEYLYGTLPSDHLPETPRRSNVSPEGKKQGSQRSTLHSLRTPTLYSATNLLGPETNAEGEEGESEPFWV